MEATGFDAWVLTLAVFLPLVGALIMMAVPKAYELEVKLIGLGSSLAALAVGVYILFQFDYGSSSELQFVVDKGWIDIINSRYRCFCFLCWLCLYVLSIAGIMCHLLVTQRRSLFFF